MNGRRRCIGFQDHRCALPAEEPGLRCATHQRLRDEQKAAASNYRLADASTGRLIPVRMHDGRPASLEALFEVGYDWSSRGSTPRDFRVIDADGQPVPRSRIREH